jgi:hypothetical protein
VGPDREKDHAGRKQELPLDDSIENVEGSLRERWVGCASSEDCTKFIVPLFKREGLRYITVERSLGMVGVFTDSPENAQRARDLLKRDAMKCGYYCWTRDGALNDNREERSRH